MAGDTGKVLRAKLAERRGMLVPGASNALAARVIEDLGFEAVYVSGAGVTNTFWGMPDLGFISLTEIAQHTTAIREAVNIPVIIDADSRLWECPERAAHGARAGTRRGRCHSA